MGYSHHRPVRFCADMLYSGHTFVTCLYGFSCGVSWEPITSRNIYIFKVLHHLLMYIIVSISDYSRLLAPVSVY